MLISRRVMRPKEVRARLPHMVGILIKRSLLALALSVLLSATDKPDPKSWSPTSDPKEILRRSVQLQDRNEKLLRQYTWQEHDVQKQFEKDGAFKVKEDAVYDVLPLAGHQFRKKIAENGQPLKADAARKEDERANKFLREHHQDNNHPDDKDASKERKRGEHQKEEEHMFAELMAAYDFTLEGEEMIGAKPAWRIRAEPHAGFHPTTRAGKFFPKLHGTLWIDKDEYQWVKIEAEALDTITAGLGMLRLHRGSHLEVEQTRINDEIWLPKHVHVYVDARALVFIAGKFDVDQQFSNYKKYVTDVKILPVAEEVPSVSRDR